VAGHFHIQRGLGIRTHLPMDCPALSIVALPVENNQRLDSLGMADFVALTKLDELGGSA